MIFNLKITPFFHISILLSQRKSKIKLCFLGEPVSVFKHRNFHQPHTEEKLDMEFNGVKLVGDVLALSPTGILLETKSETGEFSESHEVLVKPKKALKALKEGMKISLFATLEQIEKRTKIVADTKSITEVDGDEDYVNIARLIGRTAGTFQYWAPSYGKRAFGNLLVEVKGTIFRSVLFAACATGFDRICKRDSTVQVQGRLRKREFSNNAGDLDSMLEIIADPDETKVLAIAQTIDPFAERAQPAATEAKAPAKDVDGKPFGQTVADQASEEIPI
jgi:hypothetical protein